MLPMGWRPAGDTHVIEKVVSYVLEFAGFGNGD